MAMCHPMSAYGKMSSNADNANKRNAWSGTWQHPLIVWPDPPEGLSGGQWMFSEAALCLSFITWSAGTERGQDLRKKSSFLAVLCILFDVNEVKSVELF